jgi:hypothetical protein
VVLHMKINSGSSDGQRRHHLCHVLLEDVALEIQLCESSSCRLLEVATVVPSYGIRFLGSVVVVPLLHLRSGGYVKVHLGP